MDVLPVAFNPLKSYFLLVFSGRKCEVNSLALVALAISEVDIALQNAVDVLTGAGALEGEGSWPPDLVVQVPQNDLLRVVCQEGGFGVEQSSCRVVVIAARSTALHQEWETSLARLLNSRNQTIFNSY